MMKYVQKVQTKQNWSLHWNNSTKQRIQYIMLEVGWERNTEIPPLYASNIAS